jgi:hypothetical protein
MSNASLAVALSALVFIAPGCSSSDSGSTPMGPSTPALSHLSLFPERQAVAVGESVMLTVVARDTAGADLAGVVPTYSSSNPAMFRFHPDGRVDAVGLGTGTLFATAGGQSAQAVVHVGPSTYDLVALGPPRILDSNYIDLSKIGRISRFRSAIGHSYTNDTGEETCRSMKHYYEPKPTVDATSIDIYAPTAGTIAGIRMDGRGFQIRMIPRDLPVLSVLLFHVNPNPGLVPGTWVESGEHLGRHVSPFTMSDISMSIGPKQGGILISYFETMTDAVFAQYQARGVPSRQAAIITREARDADPVPCVGEQQFTSQGKLPNWLVLN